MSSLFLFFLKKVFIQQLLIGNIHRSRMNILLQNAFQGLFLLDYSCFFKKTSPPYEKKHKACCGLLCVSTIFAKTC